VNAGFGGRGGARQWRDMPMTCRDLHHPADMRSQNREGGLSPTASLAVSRGFFCSSVGSGGVSVLANDFGTGMPSTVGIVDMVDLSILLFLSGDDGKQLQWVFKRFGILLRSTLSSLL
jgi:hypothetical protein